MITVGQTSCGLRLQLVVDGEPFCGDAPVHAGRTRVTDAQELITVGARVRALLSSTKATMDARAFFSAFCAQLADASPPASWAALQIAWAHQARLRGVTQTELFAELFGATPAPQVRTALLVNDDEPLSLAAARRHQSVKLKVRPGKESLRRVRTVLLEVPDAALRLDGNRLLAIDELETVLDAALGAALEEGTRARLPLLLEEPTALREAEAALALCLRHGARVALDESLAELGDAGLRALPAQVWVLKPGALGVRRTVELVQEARLLDKEVIISGLYEGRPGLLTSVALHAVVGVDKAAGSRRGASDAGLGTARFVEDGRDLFDDAGFFVGELP